MNFSEHNNKLWLIPAIIVFFIALIPTIKYQWPLSWDIVYHIQYVKVYSQYGLTLINPLMNAPYGQKIAYPPLFHLIIALIGNLFKIDYFTVARILQPILAFSIVLSVSYVAKKFYGIIAGVSAGFLMISSYLVFRIMLPIPENLAIIFIPLIVYLYYRSINEKAVKYAILSGILFIFVILSHQAAILCLLTVIVSFTLLELVLNRNLKVFKNLFAYFAFLIILVILGLISLLIWKPDFLFTIINQGISAVTGYNASLSYSYPITAIRYIQHLGPVVLLSALIGAVFSFKYKIEKNYFIIIWIISMFLLSISYWFGINVLSNRVLIYILIPLTILGGFGIEQIYTRIRTYGKFSASRLRLIFLLFIFTVSTFSGIIIVSEPGINTFIAKTDLGNVQIAPPSDSEIELANWFTINGDRNKSIIISNLYTGNLIATISEVPIHYGFENFNKNSPLSDFKKEKIGYIVFDKRLTFPSTNGSLYSQYANSEFYALMFYSEDISKNINSLIPNYSKIVFENKDFIVCEVQY